MTKYREIIRLLSHDDISERQIADCLQVSRNTVSRVRKEASEKNISWPLDDLMTDKALENILFPKQNTPDSDKKMPDLEYIHKELLRNGVSKKLLWVEYCEECRMNGDTPLMYSRFCYYVHGSTHVYLFKKAVTHDGHSLTI